MQTNPIPNEELYYFDKKRAKASVAFFECCLKHQTGNQFAGKPFLLDTWQKKLIEDVYGWRKKSDDSKRYKQILCWVPRKNGKTTMCSGILALEMFIYPQAGGQVVTAANDRKQASICFREAKRMIESSPDLAKRCEIFTRHIIAPGDTVFRAISRDVNTADGMNISACVLDEIGRWKYPEFYYVLVNSVSARQDYTILTISTAGDGNETGSIGYQLYNMSKESLLNTEAFPSLYTVVYEADKNDDWLSEETWKKANPAVPAIKSLESMRDMVRECGVNRSRINDFKRFHLNLWVSSDDKWLDFAEWASCKGEFKEEDLSKFDCYVGIDLSNIRDYTAVAFLFVDKENNNFYIKTHFFIPDENINSREQEEKTPIRQWIEDGWITATQGSCVDYDVILEYILNKNEYYNIKNINYDIWNATQLINQLQKAGLECIQYKQDILNMSKATKEFERQIHNRRIIHDNNPLMNWMVGNTIIYTDVNGNIKPRKVVKNSRQRIDGVIASIEAYGGYMDSLNHINYDIDSFLII